MFLAPFGPFSAKGPRSPPSHHGRKRWMLARWRSTPILHIDSSSQQTAGKACCMLLSRQQFANGVCYEQTPYADGVIRRRVLEPVNKANMLCLLKQYGNFLDIRGGFIAKLDKAAAATDICGFANLLVPFSLLDQHIGERTAPERKAQENCFQVIVSCCCQRSSCGIARRVPRAIDHRFRASNAATLK